MSTFQIGSVLFALFMLYVVSIHKKKKTLSIVEASFWCSLWILFILIAIFPNLLLGITGFLKFARVFDLLVVMAFMIISIVVFLSYFNQKESQKKLEEFIRRQAIDHAKRK
jgi:hypothetical protein